MASDRRSSSGSTELQILSLDGPDAGPLQDEGAVVGHGFSPLGGRFEGGPGVAGVEEGLGPIHEGGGAATSLDRLFEPVCGVEEGVVDLQSGKFAGPGPGFDIPQKAAAEEGEGGSVGGLFDPGVAQDGLGIGPGTGCGVGGSLDHGLVEGRALKEKNGGERKKHHCGSICLRIRATPDRASKGKCCTLSSRKPTARSILPRRMTSR